MTRTKARCVAAGMLAVSLAASGCGKSEQGNPQAAGMPAFPVAVMTVSTQDTPIYSEYSAQTFARDMVEVRGRVDGYVEKRLFNTGTDVQAGQPLFILDLRPYQADVAKAKGDLAQSEANLEFAKRQVALIQAEADLAQAEANLVKAQQDVERLQPLVKEDAAAKQDLDNAAAALKANQANVNARKANVEQTRLQTRTQIETSAAQVESSKALLRTAELNLGYATITAPISGRIGDSLIQPGGLVTRTSSQPLTTIVPLDPIWVRFKVSESEYLEFMKRSKSDREMQQSLQLVLADNSVHPFPGRIQASLNQVDPKTGTLELQATFANPKHNVLPGQFGRIRALFDERKNAIVIPAKAIQELQGLQSVYTVSPDKKALARTITVSEQLGDKVIVDQGLKPGDQLVVEGGQKIRPGMPVTPQPYKEPAPAPQNQGSGAPAPGARK